MAQSWENTKTRHGTVSGWQLHRTLDEQPCDPCYRARAAYDQHRKQEPLNLRLDSVRSRAQAAARKDLANKFPTLHRQSYEKHLDRLLREEGLLDQSGGKNMSEVSANSDSSPASGT